MIRDLPFVRFHIRAVWRLDTGRMVTRTLTFELPGYPEDIEVIYSETLAKLHDGGWEFPEGYAALDRVLGAVRAWDPSDGTARR